MKQLIKESTDTESVDFTLFSTEDILQEVAKRVAVDEPEESIKKSKEGMSLAEAIDAYDPITEVISSDELLDLQMCLAVGHTAEWQNDNEPITDSSTSTDSPMSLYLYAYNKKGRIKSIKLTKNDIQIFNKIKYRPIKLGIAGTDNGPTSFAVKQIIQDINKGSSKKSDDKIRKMLVKADTYKKKFYKDPEEYSDIYHHNSAEARKALGIKKPSWIKKLWYKILGRSSELELSASILKASSKSKAGLTFPESSTAAYTAVDALARIDIDSLQTKYTEDYFAKVKELQDTLNLK